ncbi:hypothetical protein GCM10007962_22070 [Yeosuana aromativorans]|uniref:Uncharacterized protein n=1 Tax=Yeosuana aromativorans TaxID=288019 RepID=A0A8J3BNI9_9FLAO|nr:hypothetical protein [Yeosuana aromativorans]GGK27422.1 hypothetical protein GCM10007962_22070 [Yeosuana aromativorans]
MIKLVSFKTLLKGVGVLLFLIVIKSMVFFKDRNQKNDWSSEIKSYNYAIGTQTVGSKYKFTDKSMLVETALEIKKMGSNLLKFSMHPRYCTENYGLPKNDKIKSLTQLASLEPSVKTVLDMDFKFYHIWTYGFSQYTPELPGEKDDTAQIKFINGYPKSYQDALYKELFEFTSYLLKTYSGTGKVFYLGNWEGDWHLRPDYDRTKPVNPKTLEGMLQWAKIRQKAIDDAKKEIAHNNVEVYNYIEVNLVNKALKDPTAKVVANTIVKKVNPDYVSYSSYDATNPYKTEESLKKNLQKSLDYLEAQLSPKEGLPKGKRVWIGEYGNPSINYSDKVQNLRSIWTIKASLEWGTPFVLYWEMYNNEIEQKTGEQVGYWLIDDKGKKQPIWYTHNSFYNESKDFLENYFQKTGELPSFDVFRKEAIHFKSLNPKI